MEPPQFKQGMRRGGAIAVLLVSLCASGGFAQDLQLPLQYEPALGQEGKDVIWFPTPQALVDKMLGMAKVAPGDYVIDLGSGDGRTVITAAKLGVRASGIEYNPDMVELSKRNAEKEGVSDRTSFVKADLFESDLSRATVITMFLLDRINRQLRPKLFDLKPGTRLVSNTFKMGEWAEDARVHASKEEGCQAYCVAYLWIVPAKVAGTWVLPQGVLTLKQEFQMLSGQLVAGDKVFPVIGRVRGDLLSFKAGAVDYTARASGEVMVSTRKSDSNWTAARKRNPGQAL